MITKIATVRPPQRFDEDKPMRFRQNIGKYKRGSKVPANLNTYKKRRWWEYGFLERIDIPHKYIIQDRCIVECTEIKKSGWFNVTWSDGVKEKLSRKQLEGIDLSYLKIKSEDLDMADRDKLGEKPDTNPVARHTEKPKDAQSVPTKNTEVTTDEEDENLVEVVETGDFDPFPRDRDKE